MNAASQTVRVDLAVGPYEIQIGSGLLTAAAERLRALQPISHAVLISDEHVRPYCNLVADSLTAAGAAVQSLIVPAGEPSKSVAMADQLWQDMLKAGAHRQTVVLAVGGGVVGDLAGFIAATFARGLDFVQIPTTLLAQVDSSVGGKVGINLPGAKNMVGAFWQPKFVLIDTEVLATLPDREFRAGMAEVVKYGVILDESFFAFLESHAAQINARQPEVLTPMIARCCQLKAAVVAVDERETSGRRAMLNYGHTFAHAIEAVAGYGSLLHGEAVSIGMLCASRLAENLSRIDATVTQRQVDLLQAFQLPTAVPELDHAALIDAMRHDKKVQDGKLRFILPNRLGNVELVGDIDPELVREALEG